MKHFFALLFSIGVLSLSAQFDECGVDTSRVLRGVGCGTALVAPDKDVFINYFSKINPGILYQRSSIQWVPIRYHIITRNDGSCGADLVKVLESHCELNEVFNGFNIGFFITAIDTIRDNYIWTFDNEAIGPVTFAQFNDTNVLNVYVNGNLPGMCGFATLPQYDPRGGGIFMHKACMGRGDKTLHHEVGHYLSLIHTFEHVLGVELVNGSNCATAGDLICDTPADFPNHSGMCPYEGDMVDSNGDYYRDVIDETIYMSYFDNRCKTRFTPMQIAAMVTNLNDVRPYLLTTPAPDVTPLAAPVYIQPFSNEMVNSSNQVFRWNRIDRARYYRFILASATSSEVMIDRLLTDTVFNAGELFAGKAYKYMVQPIGYGNACASLSTWQYMQTSKLKLEMQLALPNCYDLPVDTVIATAFNGTPPYTFRWSDGSGDSMLVNVGAGDYILTVTDYNNNSVTEKVTVIYPPAFSAGIHATPNNLVATGTGGTPPYTYKWSNGVNNRFNSFPQFGEYAVTITDAKGCEAVSQFSYTSIGLTILNKAVMRVYPNPAASHVNIQLELPERAEGTLSIVNINGGIVQQMKKEFTGGANNCQLNVNSLAGGIYFVKFYSAGITQTERLSIIR